MNQKLYDKEMGLSSVMKTFIRKGDSMKSVLKSVVILLATTTLFSACGHRGHHGHADGKACSCSADQTASCKCEKKDQSANKDNKKAECEECKKGT